MNSLRSALTALRAVRGVLRWRRRGSLKCYFEPSFSVTSGRKNGGRSIPLFANPSTILRISSLLRIPPFSMESSHANKMGCSDVYDGNALRGPKHFLLHV